MQNVIILCVVAPLITEWSNAATNKLGRFIKYEFVT